MDHSVLERCSLFKGIPAQDVQGIIEATPHRVREYEKGETVFRLMDTASWLGVVLEGSVQAQKSFPNGSQINVSTFGAGSLIGAAAVFAAGRRYPCDVVALGPVSVLLFKRGDMLVLMQKDIRVLENLTTGVASAAYMLQQRLELLSYKGIAQKAAFYLLMRARQTGKQVIRIPGSMSKWAMMMNVSRPSLHRELARLEAEGIIAYAPPVIRILKPEALQEVLSR